MTNSMRPFASDRELMTFANYFLRSHVLRLRKDIGICLTANKKGEHAYFPALMACIGVLELLSGLFAGKLRGVGCGELVSYAKIFMNAAYYDETRLTLLYQCFRHKIAHLSAPYVVFDTSTDRNVPGPRRRVTWKVCAKRRNGALPIELVPVAPPRTLPSAHTPWRVEYDHIINIRIHHLKVDVVKSIYGPSGYLAWLEADRTARARFAQCMVEFYPKIRSTGPRRVDLQCGGR